MERYLYNTSRCSLRICLGTFTLFQFSSFFSIFNSRNSNGCTKTLAHPKPPQKGGYGEGTCHEFCHQMLGVKLNSRIHTRTVSFIPLIRVRGSCGPSARWLPCLGEQTGSCLWWHWDQSRGHILRSHAKVAVVRTLLPCFALQLGYPRYT